MTSGVAADNLSADDLKRVYTQAADRAREVSPQSVIAVVDRDGRVLLVRRADGSDDATPAERAIAVSKAGTAAFLSSNGHAFSSRTAGFIIQPHFPPRVLHRPPGPLVGVGFSSMAYSDVNYFRELDGRRIPGTRLYASPGGVPLYKNGVLVAGVGVTGDGTEQEDASITGADIDEAVAMAGQLGFTPAEEIFGSRVLIDGIRVPYVESEGRLAEKSSGVSLTTVAQPPAPIVWPMAVLGGVLGEVHAPIRGDPVPNTIAGQPRLTVDEVRQIITKCAERTLITRAGIRLPYGKAAQMFISVVNNPNLAGQAPAVLGTFRTPDATVFSWDVSVQKARTVVFFSSSNRAYSARTIAFLAQSLYPPGLDGQPAGPFFGLQERFAAPVLTGAGAPNPNLPNGITLFPGGFPLYRNGVLIGAIAVSGDGIEQDDLVAAAGTVGFQPAPSIRADNFAYLDARLPYAKFPRDPELRPAVAPVPAALATAASIELAPAEIVHVSARGWIAPDAPLTLGFATDAAAETSPTLLLRGVGPALASQEVPDALTAPTTRLFDSTGTVIAANSAWGQSPDAAAIATTTEQLGAFALDSGSADNALLTSLAPGAYAMVLGSDAGAAGTGMVEVFDATVARAAGTVKNISIRGRVESSGRILSAAIELAGEGNRQVLIRSVGPTLVNERGDAMSVTPGLRLLNAAGQTVAEGARWDFGSNVEDIGAASMAVGAAALETGAVDSALLVSLSPGSYTVQISAPEGVAGEARAEIYAVPAK